MNDDVILRMSGRQKEQLTTHLFPGDGLEAVALILCGRRHGHDRHCLSAMEIVPVPYDQCERAQDRVTWRTEILSPLLERAATDGFAVVKVHSHPGGFEQFSRYDDESDFEFFRTTADWTESDSPHGSAVVLPCGRMFGRFGAAEGGFERMSMISIAGETIEYWVDDIDSIVPDFADRHAQVLGEGTFAALRGLRVAVVGCSGTGSPTVEQLFRLGVGSLLLVDPDIIGPENLNRIINSRHLHSRLRTPKVVLLADAIDETGLGTNVIALAEDLCVPTVIEAVATCDAIFGCVDSVFARHLLNKIACTYCIPYIDVGVGLRADGRGGIAHVTGAIHYLQPDGSSLFSRQAFSLEDIRAEALRRTDPDEYSARLDDGYIKGAEVGQPAVMPINMIFSGYGVFEFLSRLHEIRDDGNVGFANQRWSLSGGFHDSPTGRRTLPRRFAEPRPRRYDPAAWDPRALRSRRICPCKLLSDCGFGF